MTANQALDLSTLSKYRSNIIDCLLYPQKTIVVQNNETPLNLSQVVRRDPERLQELGLIKESVFSPTCIDPARGSWVVGRFTVWIDAETSRPLDAQTVKVLDRLPDSLETVPSPKLIDLLAPTYLRNREDAETLTTVLNQRGPSSGWVE